MCRAASETRWPRKYSSRVSLFVTGSNDEAINLGREMVCDSCSTRGVI